MNNKPCLYLIGKMSGLSWEEMNGWREEAEKIFKDDFIVINPCRFYNFKMLENKSQQQKNSIEKEAKDFDLWAIKRSDITIFNLNYPDTTGSSIEAHMAQYWNIPVIGYGGMKHKEKIHPWICNSINVWCEDLDSAAEHIYKFYYPVLCGK